MFFVAGRAEGAEAVAHGAVVKRTVGFGNHFEFVAEVTATTRDGFLTLREFGHTADGAMSRARMAVAERLTARRRATGFTASGFRETSTRAPFAPGFA